MARIWRDGAVTLEAGALTIGALAAADGVNIGSVKTLTTAGVAFDAAKETGGNLASIKTAVERAAGTGVASASATVAVGADATVAIVAAPGLGKQIWVYGWVLIANVDGTFALKSAATVKYGTMPITKLGGSAPFSSDFEIPIFKCASNEALNITTTTCTLAGGVTYAIRDE